MHMPQQQRPAATQRWEVHVARLGTHPTQQTLGHYHLGGGSCLVWRLEAYGDGQAQWNSWGCCQGSGCWPHSYTGPGLLLCLALMDKR